MVKVTSFFFFLQNHVSLQVFIVKLIIQICINRHVYYMPGSANSPQNFYANLKIISLFFQF